jgi:hypothetical protein
MRMVHVEEGFAIPAGETILLERGGMHVMLMGLTARIEQGDEIEVTLTFEEAGDMTVMIPVDNERMPEHGPWHAARAARQRRLSPGIRPARAKSLARSGRSSCSRDAASARFLFHPARRRPPVHLPDSTSSTHAGTAAVAGPVSTRSNRPGTGVGSRLISSVSAPAVAAMSTKPAAG